MMRSQSTPKSAEKLARPIDHSYRFRMEQALDCPSAEEVSWLAIRQPGVIRLLERRLWTPDGDAFAAALELVCRLFGELAATDGLPLPRLDHRLLDAGVAAVAAGACDPTLDAWIRDQLAGLPVMLGALEETEVVAVIAAVIWAAADVRSEGVLGGVAV
jgi:hypothetical protein